MVDEVYVMKTGELAEHGSYETLLDHNGEFAEFVREFFLNGEFSVALRHSAVYKNQGILPRTAVHFVHKGGLEQLGLFMKKLQNCHT